jgi:dTMP kinase
MKNALEVTVGSKSIREDLAEGTTVVIDRYYYSGCAYSAAKNNPELNLKWARQPEVGLPRPDLCIFLDISSEDAAKRGGYGKEKYEKKEMQDRVRELFEVLMEGDEKGGFVKINAGGNVEEVQEAVQKAAQKVLERIDDKTPLRFVEPW